MQGHKHNQLGNFQVTANGISRLTRIVRQIADTYSGGKLVSVLEGGYADNPRDTTVKGTDDTYSGLAQCADTHIKTLLTGDEQPETPFFSSAKAISMHTPKPHSTIQWRNGRLTGLPTAKQPLKLIIFNVNGQRISVINGITQTWVAPDFRKPAKGTYTLTLYDRNGKMLYKDKIIF